MREIQAEIIVAVALAIGGISCLAGAAYMSVTCIDMIEERADRDVDVDENKEVE